MALKYDDAKMLKFFWNEKEDLTRYAGYERILPQLEEEYPLLFEGLSMIEKGEDLVAIMLDNIIEESFDEDYE